MLLQPTTTTTAVDCTYTGDKWHWGYEGVYGPSCWGTHVEACNGRKQSPIDIPAKYGGLLPGTETVPLSMTGYKAVRFATFSNTGENYGAFQLHQGGDDDRVSNGIFKNNGHTAVCITASWSLQSHRNLSHSATGRRVAPWSHAGHPERRSTHGRLPDPPAPLPLGSKRQPGL